MPSLRAGSRPICAGCLAHEDEVRTLPPVEEMARAVRVVDERGVGSTSVVPLPSSVDGELVRPDCERETPIVTKTWDMGNFQSVLIVNNLAFCYRTLAQLSCTHLSPPQGTASSK